METGTDNWVDLAKWSDICATIATDPEYSIYCPNLVTNAAAMRRAVSDSLRAALSNRRTLNPRIRAFRHHLLDFAASEYANQSERRDEPFESIDNWFNRLRKCDVTCAILNGFDRWSPRATNHLRNELVRTMEKSAIDIRGGLGWYSFLAHDGWTPFGLHTDPESSLIFHLGPSPKPVWTWPRGVAPRTAGGRGLLPSERYTVDVDSYIG